MARATRPTAEAGRLILSAPLTLAGISLRRRQQRDQPFLAALFAAVRGPMLDGTGWPEARRQAFLAEQFALQTRHYRTAYPDLWPGIVEHGGEAIGRLDLWRRTGEIRVVELALLPAARGRGLGGELLRCVLAEAERDRRSVGLSVDPASPALRLYRRLGFQAEAATSPASQPMRWRPPAADPPEASAPPGPP